MTTHKIDPGIVRKVLGIKGEIIDIEINSNQIIVERGAGMFPLVINIHEFKDMAIEWCAGKGWYSNTFLRKDLPKNGGYITVWEKDDTKPSTQFWFPPSAYPSDIKPIYSDKLSAELAAIDFVWKQIQKEKKDEN